MIVSCHHHIYSYFDQAGLYVILRDLEFQCTFSVLFEVRSTCAVLTSDIRSFIILQSPLKWDVWPCVHFCDLCLLGSTSNLLSRVSCFLLLPHFCAAAGTNKIRRNLEQQQLQSWWDVPAPAVTVASSQAPPFLWERLLPRQPYIMQQPMKDSFQIKKKE